MPEHPSTSGDDPAVVARPVTTSARPAVPAARPTKPPSRLSALELPDVPRRDATLDLLLVLIATIIAPNLAQLFIVFDAGDLADAGGAAEISTALIVQKCCEATLAVMLLVYFVFRNGVAPARLGLRRGQWLSQCAWGGAALAGVYVALVVGVAMVLVIVGIFPQAAGDMERRVEFLEAFPSLRLGPMLVLLIAVAIHEEIIFRGLLLPLLRRVSGSWVVAVAVSSLLFAALHIPGQGLLGAMQVLGVAVALSLFFLASRSLLAVMLAHFLFDFAQLQLVRLLPDLQHLAQQAGS